MGRWTTELLEPRRLMHGGGDVFTYVSPDGLLQVVGIDSPTDSDTVRVYISTVDGQRFVNAERTGPEGSAPSGIGFLESDITGILISTYQGNDTILIAQQGDNWTIPVTVFAGKGNDTIVGSSNSETLFGGSGDDSILAGGGADFVSGADGNDTIDAGTGPDTVLGGAGNDSIVGGNGYDQLFGLSNDGAVLLVGQTDFDTIFGGAGNDTLSGGPNADVLYGGTTAGSPNSGDDYLAGGTGHDTLYGSDGNDTLVGGKGNDLLIGGVGINAFYAQDGQADTIEDSAVATTLLFDADLDVFSTRID